jgi:branched-chain amino acid transport system ATP-binding protein
MLSIVDLQSGYGKKHVLHGVSMHVGAGEAVCLLGRNGMGKTPSCARS